ncbi:hypothetical protein CO051_00260 [Candidatus Roizmanbacteria bacterium CG_4_9_14_0_2_um_filter_39_13]|uniref:Uncharacterized protein n=1 Tax=Candidatus Roizmanbacteria bacterium CG_4_9_14_0_2_um_filter_39_13 TaxID=1974839 RepID=A0A2M8F4G0_9BACT|nr:MAG: hypothetical protein CO051_00260 [Candidatus Roizmanbacteria bacterium CG_4_9_14_0_2_um_filter_39_13]
MSRANILLFLSEGCSEKHEVLPIVPLRKVKIYYVGIISDLTTSVNILLWFITAKLKCPPPSK